MANYVPFAVRVRVVDHEASLTAGLGKPPAYRNLVGLCELLQTLRFSLVRLIIAAVSSSRNDFAKHEVRCLHVRGRERQRFSELQKIGVPRVSGSLHSSLGQSKIAFSSGRLLYLESGSKRF